MKETNKSTQDRKHKTKQHETYQKLGALRCSGSVRNSAQHVFRSVRNPAQHIVPIMLRM